MAKKITETKEISKEISKEITKEIFTPKVKDLQIENINNNVMSEGKLLKIGGLYIVSAEKAEKLVTSNLAKII